jgi:chromosome partitioning protein
MRTLAVIGLKGGSGKTTIATHVALAGHMRGLTTLVADVDPQGSSREVLKARAGEGPEVVDATGSHLLDAQMTAVNAGIQLMVIDTAAGAIEEVGQAIVLADLSLLVVRPTLLDLAAMVRTVEVLRRLKKPALVVVNQAAPARDGVEPPMVKRCLRALEFMRLPVAPVIIRSRAVYQTVLETGRSAEEAWDDTAAEEMSQLWAFIERFALGQRDGPLSKVAER